MRKPDYILIVLLSVIALSLILNAFKKPIINLEGYTPQEVEYLFKIKELENDKSLLRYEIEKFKDEIIKDSVYIHNASTQQLDSLWAEYFK